MCGVSLPRVSHAFSYVQLPETVLALINISKCNLHNRFLARVLLCEICLFPLWFFTQGIAEDFSPMVWRVILDGRLYRLFVFWLRPVKVTT